ncbi:cold shock domain-containing protein [Campylobacter jejuni]|nr:cold shock domain-containing protein [Campylobacter jejuni]
MMKGTIKFYNSNDGYGFIFSADTNKDYYFNITEWKSEILPNAGQKVEFSEFENKKGLGAKDIKLLENYLSQENSKYSDDRMVCPSCAKKIIPRIQYLNNAPYASHCPYCGVMIKKFQSDLRNFLLFIIVLAIILVGYFIYEFLSHHLF